MRNPLQEQLLKAGLAKKGKLDEIAREQAKQRHARKPAAPPVDRVDARQLQAERAERDRALSAARQEELRLRELHAQARQLVATHAVAAGGEIAYAFEHDGAIRRVLVDAAQRAQLAKGALVVAVRDADYALLPRAAADRVLARDASLVALDHGAPSGAAGADSAAATADGDEDAAHYARFVVPDDLVW